MLLNLIALVNSVSTLSFDHATIKNPSIKTFNENTLYISFCAGNDAKLNDFITKGDIIARVIITKPIILK